MTNILVVSCSRTGTTSRIGSELAMQLEADFERVEEIENRGGALGFTISAVVTIWMIGSIRSMPPWPKTGARRDVNGAQPPRPEHEPYTSAP